MWNFFRKKGSARDEYLDKVRAHVREHKRIPDQATLNALVSEAKRKGVLFKVEHLVGFAEQVLEQERTRSASKSASASRSSGGTPKPKKKKKKRILTPYEAALERQERIKIALAMLALVAIAGSVIYVEFVR